MIKTLKNLLKQDKERYSVPRKVQDVIPIQRIWKDGIGNIDEHLNGEWKRTSLDFPYSNHAEAMNKVQAFFVERHAGYSRRPDKRRYTRTET